MKHEEYIANYLAENVTDNIINSDCSDGYEVTTEDCKKLAEDIVYDLNNEGFDYDKSYKDNLENYIEAYLDRYCNFDLAINNIL